MLRYQILQKQGVEFLLKSTRLPGQFHAASAAPHPGPPVFVSLPFQEGVTSN